MVVVLLHYVSGSSQTRLIEDSEGLVSYLWQRRLFVHKLIEEPLQRTLSLLEHQIDAYLRIRALTIKLSLC